MSEQTDLKIMDWYESGEKVGFCVRVSGVGFYITNDNAAALADGIRARLAAAETPKTCATCSHCQVYYDDEEWACHSEKAPVVGIIDWDWIYPNAFGCIHHNQKPEVAS